MLFLNFRLALIPAFFYSLRNLHPLPLTPTKMRSIPQSIEVLCALAANIPILRSSFNHTYVDT